MLRRMEGLSSLHPVNLSFFPSTLVPCVWGSGGWGAAVDNSGSHCWCQNAKMLLWQVWLPSRYPVSALSNIFRERIYNSASTCDAFFLITIEHLALCRHFYATKILLFHAWACLAKNIFQKNKDSCQKWSQPLQCEESWNKLSGSCVNGSWV